MALAIDQTTGALTPVSGSPFGGPGVQAIVTTAAGTVSSATLVSLALRPSPLTITTSQLGSTTQLVLIGTYSDGTMRSLTESASWSVLDRGIVTLSNLAGDQRPGHDAWRMGRPSITASYGGLTGSGTLTVQQPAIASIAVTPASPTIASGTAIQFTAVATYSDGSTQNVTALATWTSSDLAVATVSNTAGSQGLSTAIAAGTSTITATYTGVTGTATITVTAVSGAAARFVYGGVNTGVVGYIVDQATGGLTGVPGGPVVNGSGFTTYSVTTDPTGRLVYSGSDLGIFVFTSNAVTGQLTNAIPAGGLEQTRGYGVTATNSANPTYRGMAMDPRDDSCLRFEERGNLLDAYLVDGGNGGLTLMASYATGTTPRAVTVDPTGKYVYVANLNSSTVSAYLVNETTGALTPVAGSPFASISNPRALAIDPSGHHLYVGGSNGGVAGLHDRHYVRRVDGRQRVAVRDGRVLFTNTGVAIEPTGRFLYAQNSSTGKDHGFRHRPGQRGADGGERVSLHE